VTALTPHIGRTSPVEAELLEMWVDADSSRLLLR
jgi:hypothetical protein